MDGGAKRGIIASRAGSRKSAEGGQTTQVYAPLGGGGGEGGYGARQGPSRRPLSARPATTVGYDEDMDGAGRGPSAAASGLVGGGHTRVGRSAVCFFVFAATLVLGAP